MEASSRPRPRRREAHLEKASPWAPLRTLLLAAFPDKYFGVNQYSNPDNLDAHHDHTGREIWAQTGGAVTHFCMSSSTGGCIQGVGKFLKAQSRAKVAEQGGVPVKIVMADPEKSKLAGILLSREDPDAGRAALAAVDAQIEKEGQGVAVEGAGKESLTGLMVPDKGRGRHKELCYVDAAIPVNDFDAFDECRATAASGLLVGGSSGVNLFASKKIATECAAEAPRAGGVTIVTLLCDHGIKYLSKVFNDEWMAANDTRPKL